MAGNSVRNERMQGAMASETTGSQRMQGAVASESVGSQRVQGAVVGKSARNEQAKLTSVFLNNIGVAAVVTSVVAPIFSDHLPPREEMIYTILGLITALGLHLCARFVLRQIKD